MKWKTTPRAPQNAMRVVQKFAWLPIQLNDEYTIWLEKYYSVERRECDLDGCFWRPEYTTQDNDTATRILKCLNP